MVVMAVMLVLVAVVRAVRVVAVMVMAVTVGATVVRAVLGLLLVAVSCGVLPKRLCVGFFLLRAVPHCVSLDRLEEGKWWVAAVGMAMAPRLSPPAAGWWGRGQPACRAAPQGRARGGGGWLGSGLRG